MQRSGGLGKSFSLSLCPRISLSDRSSAAGPGASRVLKAEPVGGGAGGRARAERASAPRGGLPRPLKGVRRSSAAPPAGSRAPPPAGSRRAAGTLPPAIGSGPARGTDASAPGCQDCRSRGPRRAGALFGTRRPKTRVALTSVAMSSVFGKPRAGSGLQIAPLEVNLAILGHRGAGKSGEWRGIGERRDGERAVGTGRCGLVGFFSQEGC